MTQIGKFSPYYAAEPIKPRPSRELSERIRAATAANPFVKVHAPGTSAHGRINLTAVAAAFRRDPKKTRQQCIDAGENPDEWFRPWDGRNLY